jgi:AcrR family transcriptional regulator
MNRTEKKVREIIINVARRIFARFGFRKTTVDEIAQAAHKAKSSIYHYFKGKEEIFQAVVEMESKVLEKELTKAIKQEDDPRKKVHVYIITRMKVLNRLANFYNALKDEYFEHYGFIERLREKYYKDEIKVMRDILKTGVDDGVFVIKDVKVTAFAIITALKGLEYSWVLENDVPKTERNIDALLEILFNGIVKR